MILTPIAAPPEKRIRSLAKTVREQLSKEWENKTLPSGVHEQWDSIDMAERIFELTMKALYNINDFDNMSSEQFYAEMKELVDKGWRPE